MSFERGTFAVTIFELPDKLPDDYIERFAARKAGTLDSVTDELQVGWVSGRHLLENNITEETISAGIGCRVTLRKAVRKIPASLLNAMCSREELIWMRANESDFVPSRVKKELKEEILEKNLQKFPRAVSGIPAVIDMATDTLYICTGSTAQLDEFLMEFNETLHLDPVPFAPAGMTEELAGCSVGDIPSLELVKGALDEPNVNRDFLTALWYFNETGRTAKHPEFGEFEIAVDGPLVFANDEDGCNGAAEISVKNGENPLRSAEAKAALSVGKKLRKAKISLVRGDEVWSCVFDADKFNFSGMKLPEGEKLDQDSVFGERLLSCYIFKSGIAAFFRLYAEMMLGVNREKEVAAIQRWAAEHDGV